MFFLLLFLGILLAYGYSLNRRLSIANPSAYALGKKPLPDNELAKLTYPTPEDMASAAGPATGKAYVVIGGSGLVGRYIIRTLLGRGERFVRIIDVTPPDVSGDPSGPDHISRAEYVRADVTDLLSIKEALSKPFKNGVTAQVVIHTVAVIRHWERLSYLKHISHKVNVGGIENVLKASQDLGSVRAFVFTSSAATLIPPAKFLRLGYENKVIFGDEIPENMPLINGHYTKTKREADALVRAADGVKGIRTGVLRPGMVIAGPGDLWLSAYFHNTGPNIVWGGDFFQTLVNTWDLARAHIQLADALETHPDNVAGKGYAITGDPSPSSFDDLRHVMQVFCHRDLGFRAVPPLPLYVLSHILEVFFLARFYILSKFSSVRVAPIPQWAIATKVGMLQPSMWDLAFADYIIDDTRARKLLGYRNLWSNEQTIKWTIDTLEQRLE